MSDATTKTKRAGQAQPAQESVQHLEALSAALTKDMQNRMIEVGRAICDAIKITEARGAATLQAAAADLEKAARARGEITKDAADEAAQAHFATGGWLTLALAILAIFVVTTSTMAAGWWSWTLFGLAVFLLGASVGGLLMMRVLRAFP